VGRVVLVKNYLPSPSCPTLIKPVKMVLRKQSTMELDKALEVKEAIKAMIDDGVAPIDAINEVVAVRGVKAKGYLNQKQTKQLILNGKARSLMKQAKNFLSAAGKLDCPESLEALKHVDMAIDVLDDVCADPNKKKEKKKKKKEKHNPY